jgi:hypothetical protein
LEFNTAVSDRNLFLFRRLIYLETPASHTEVVIVILMRDLLTRNGNAATELCHN